VVVRDQVPQRAADEELKLSRAGRPGIRPHPPSLDRITAIKIRAPFQQPHDAAVPGRAENLGIGGLDALLGVAEHWRVLSGTVFSRPTCSSPEILRQRHFRKP
jgi:hypothetical protein